MNPKKIVRFWPAALAFAGAVVVAVATLNEAEHTRWALLGASLAAVGALAMAIDQARGEDKLESLITGGSSLVYFEFVKRRDQPGARYIISAVHQGNETVHNLSATMTNVAALLKTPADKLPQVQPSILLGNVVPDTRMAVNDIIFPAQEVRFQVTFQASNGMWMETVIGHPVGDSHVFALLVWKTDFSKPIPTKVVLFEHVDSAFPRGADNTIDWSLGSVTLTEEIPGLPNSAAQADQKAPLSSR